ncbi:MAG: hypothetical protein Q4A71_05120 [Actinomycetaceae bacterium]|nr:hypothetical protein [Actinomycetaceae bacterium]
MPRSRMRVGKIMMGRASVRPIAVLVGRGLGRSAGGSVGIETGHRSGSRAPRPSQAPEAS